MHDSLIAVAGARGRIPSANYNSRQALCKNHEHFHSISRLPSALLRNSSDKVCAALRTPRIRAADTFICSATNTSHLYKAPIYLARGRWPFCTDAYAHTSTQTQKPTQTRERPFYDARFSDISPTFPCFITFAIISVRRVQSHETISILIHHSLA